MMPTRLTLAPLVLAMACSLTPAAVHADTFTGLVVSIVDGDTLVLQVGRQHYTLELVAIDAPERVQTWGEQSRTHLSRLAINQPATARCTLLERWDHQMCSVQVNGVDLGQQQLANGMAWWDRQNASTLSADASSGYAHAELMAKLRRLGLWGETNPVPPWQFRGTR